MVKVVYFASIRERLGCEQEQLSLDSDATVATLLQALCSRGAPWDQVLNGSTLLVAVNHEMVGMGQSLQAGDEVAFFPPVTGG